MLLSLLACGLWITPGEQAERLAELDGGDSGDSGSGGDSGDSGGADSGGDSGDSGDSGGGSDRVVVELLDEFEFSGTLTHATLYHAPDGGVLSRLVWCGSLGGDNDAWVDSVEALSEGDYDRRYVYDVDDPLLHATRGGAYEGGVPFLLPVSPDFPVPAGEVSYDFIVNAANVPFGCSAVTRYDSSRATGRLSVRLVYSTTTESGADATSGPWPAALQFLGEGFEASGIDLTITPEEAPAACAVTVVRNATDATDLAACVGDPGAREVVLVVVDEVRAPWLEAGETFGRTEAPGVPLLGEGPQSIAVVGLDAVDLGERGLARVLAHHLGHFLGLFDLHSVTGATPDPIADNATCSDIGDHLDVGDCTSGAADNAMWPYATESQAIAFTADQAWVMRRSAAVRP